MILVTLLAAGLAAPTPEANPPVVKLAQVIIRERVIVRIPTRVNPERRPTRWRDRPGPKCMPLEGIAGAILVDSTKVDFILPGGPRIRAELEASCPALDYYSGFYLKPGEDGMICADRDAIHARSGGECEISRFRKLIPRVSRCRNPVCLDKRGMDGHAPSQCGTTNVPLFSDIA